MMVKSLCYRTEFAARVVVSMRVPTKQIQQLVRYRPTF